MRAFADALDSVPMALAENSGLSPIETLANIKSRQAKERNFRLGVDCMQTGSNGKSHASSFFLLRPPIVSASMTLVVVPLLPSQPLPVSTAFLLSHSLFLLLHRRQGYHQQDQTLALF